MARIINSLALHVRRNDRLICTLCEVWVGRRADSLPAPTAMVEY